MKEIKTFLIDCSKNNEVIYPHPRDIFKALELTSFDNVNPFITNNQKKYLAVCQLTNFKENPWHLKHI